MYTCTRTKAILTAWLKEGRKSSWLGQTSLLERGLRKLTRTRSLDQTWRHASMTVSLVYLLCGSIKKMDHYEKNGPSLLCYNTDRPCPKCHVFHVCHVWALPSLLCYISDGPFFRKWTRPGMCCTVVLQDSKLQNAVSTKEQ